MKHLLARLWDSLTFWLIAVFYFVAYPMLISYCTGG